MERLARLRELLRRWWSHRWVRVVGSSTWVVVVAGIISPPPLFLPGSLLDSSWILGLVLAHRQSLHFGTDIVWTYGPLGFLNFPYYFTHREWLEAALSDLAVHVLLVALIAVLLIRSSAQTWKWAIVTLALLLPSSVLTALEFELLLCVVLLLHLTVVDRRGRLSMATAVAAGVLAGASALVKETDLVQGLAIVVIAALLLVRSGRLREIGAMSIGYVLTLAALWFVCGQNLADVGPYLRATIEIASGYSAAVGVNGSNGATLTAIVLACTLVAIAVLAWRDGNRRLECLPLLLTPVAFVTFRDDFVRAGDRQYDFYSFMAVALALLAVEVGAQAPERIRVPNPRSSVVVGLALAASIALVAQGAIRFPFSTINERRGQWAIALGLVRQSDAARAETLAVRASLAAQYGIDETVLGLARQGTVDVYPTDIDAIFAYDLRWAPRPVLGAYASDTSYLDGLDAAFFRGLSRPDRVLYAYGTIDNRYAMFDEPQTTRSLIENYEVEALTTRRTGVRSFLLLSARAASVSDDAHPEGRTCAALGTPIAIPSIPGRYVYAQISMPYSLWGFIENLAYKPADAMVSFQLADGGPIPPQRFIPAVATGGVFVSGYIADEVDATALFGGTVKRPLQSMTFDSPNRSDYSGEVCASFASRAAP